MGVHTWRGSSHATSNELYILQCLLFCVSIFSSVLFADAQPSEEYRSLVRTITCPVSQCTCVSTEIYGPVDNGVGDHITRNVEIICSNAALRFVPEFSSMSEVRSLNLSGNAFTELKDNTFRGINTLDTLDLASNNIKYIEAKAFTGLNNLTYLSIEHNYLNDLDPDTFQYLGSLAHLDLSYNNLTTLPDGLFRHTSRLSTLSIHHNMLISLSHFPSNIIITDLDISYNPLLELDIHVMSSLVHLEKLNIAFTGISDPEPLIHVLTTDTFSHISQLNVSSNNFIYLNASQLDILVSKVDMLDLSGNPFRCDCSVQSMVQWIDDNTKRLQKYIHNWIMPTCRYPDYLVDIRVSDLIIVERNTECEQGDACDSSNLSNQKCIYTSLENDKGKDKVVTPIHFPVKTSRFEYDRMHLDYDPMLGWWTAACLVGMMGALILCLLLELAKRKAVQFWRTRWRRKRRRIWEAAKATRGSCDEENDSAFPLQYQTPVYYSNEIRLDVVPETVRMDSGGTSSNMLRAAASVVQIPNNKQSSPESAAADFSRQCSRRLSVSWGPTSDMSETSKSQSPSLTPNQSIRKMSTIAHPSSPFQRDTSVNRTQSAPPIYHQHCREVSLDLDLSTETRPRYKCMNQGKFKQKSSTHNKNSTAISPSQESLVQYLEQISQDIHVTKVHPDCPIHNHDKLEQLKGLLKGNPDKSLKNILEEYCT